MDNDLNINITATDEATETINSVGSSVSGLVDTVTEAGELMAEGFSTAEEAVIQSAQDAATAIADAYENVVGSVSESLAAGTTSLDEWFATATDSQIAALDAYDQRMADQATAMAGIGEEAGNAYGTAFSEAAVSSIPTFEESVAELSAIMATDGAEAGAAYGEAFETAGTPAMEGAFSYFKYLMLGYFASQVGSGIMDAASASVSTAAGQPNQIAALQASIEQQQASIQQNEAALQKWNGTTLEVQAAHAKAAANIQAETVKIAELERQLQPLQAAYDQSKGSVAAYDAEILQLSTDWSIYQSTIGSTVLPLLTKLAGEVDNIVNKMTAWAKANPEAAKNLLELEYAAGLLLKVLGYVLVGWGLWSVASKIFAPEIEAIAGVVGPLVTGLIALDPVTLAIAAAFLAVAAAVVLIVTHWNEVKTFIDYWGQQSGVFSALHEIWNSIGQVWNDLVVPALKQLWQALQPLMPYLREMAEIFGVALLVSLGIIAGLILGLVVGVLVLGAAIVWIVTKVLNTWMDWWNGFLNLGATVVSWFQNLPAHIQSAINSAIAFFQPLIDKVQSLITLIAKLPGNIFGGIGSALSGAAGAVGSVFTAMASGGVVTSPTLALIGEAGPEAVIPLSAFNGGDSLAGVGGGGSSGGGNIVVNITGTFLSQDAARQLANMMTQGVNRQIKMRSFA